MKLVLASNTAKKLAELQLLFADLPIELVAQGTLGIADLVKSQKAALAS